MVDVNSTTEAAGSEVDDLLQKAEFGAQLRQAREQAGLSVRDVAERLLISEDIIRAIDNSRSDLLPAATFTQGYIRSYARILNVNADSTINAYNQVIPEAKQILTPHSVLPARKTSPGQMFIRLLMIALVVGIAAVFFWIYDSGYKLPEIPSVISPDSKDFPDVRMQEDEPFTQMESIPSTEEIDIGNVDPLQQSITDLPAEAVSSGDDSEMVAKDSLPATAAAVEMIKTDRLVISALQESWCEVTDAEGERLIYRLLASGEEVVLDGKLPFKIFLGNARQVRIELNNTIINFDHLIRSSSNTVNIELLSESSFERYKTR